MWKNRGYGGPTINYTWINPPVVQGSVLIAFLYYPTSLYAFKILLQNRDTDVEKKMYGYQEGKWGGYELVDWD